MVITDERKKIPQERKKVQLGDVICHWCLKEKKEQSAHAAGVMIQSVNGVKSRGVTSLPVVFTLSLLLPADVTNYLLIGFSVAWANFISSCAPTMLCSSLMTV